MYLFQGDNKHCKCNGNVFFIMFRFINVNFRGKVSVINFPTRLNLFKSLEKSLNIIGECQNVHK